MANARQFPRSGIGCGKREGMPIEIEKKYRLTKSQRKAIVERLHPFTKVTKSIEDIFLDWGDTETFSLKLGRGECAA